MNNSIVYNGGAYGNFINWYLLWVTGKVDFHHRPWTKLKNAHNYDRSAGYKLIHPIEANNPNGKLQTAMADLSSQYDKIVFLHPTPDTMIWNINNQFQKIYPEKWVENYIDSNYFNLSQWVEKKEDLEVWHIREWLSMMLYDQQIAEARLDEALEIRFDNVINISLEDLKFRFIKTTELLMDFLKLNSVRTEYDIDLLHQEWLKLQDHKDKDAQVKLIVHGCINDVEVDMTNLTIVDESQVQRVLRDEHHVHLRCYNLNQFPTTITELRQTSYLYPIGLFR